MLGSSSNANAAGYARRPDGADFAKFWRVRNHPVRQPGFTDPCLQSGVQGNGLDRRLRDTTSRIERKHDTRIAALRKTDGEHLAKGRRKDMMVRGLVQIGFDFLQRENAMDALLGIITSVGHAIERVLSYIDSHHWIFGLLALGYIFYLHDRALHARFDALEKRVDEIRKRLAIEY